MLQRMKHCLPWLINLNFADRVLKSAYFVLKKKKVLVGVMKPNSCNLRRSAVLHSQVKVADIFIAL